MEVKQNTHGREITIVVRDMLHHFTLNRMYFAFTIHIKLFKCPFVSKKELLLYKFFKTADKTVHYHQQGLYDT